MLSRGLARFFLFSPLLFTLSVTQGADRSALKDAFRGSFKIGVAATRNIVTETARGNRSLDLVQKDIALTKGAIALNESGGGPIHKGALILGGFEKK